ncbi:hypothetical protein [Arsenophonus nasoniae]|uniref:hypothetical protein n=1 Tax=Arsenophonus nasoniae TaxID=638 RepID=UPI0038790912
MVTKLTIGAICLCLTYSVSAKKTQKIPGNLDVCWTVDGDRCCKRPWGEIECYHGQDRQSPL